jgi:molybdopterin synthase catalytic subunit
MIRVQREDFDPGAEIAALTRDRPGIGGVVSFIGLVRDLSGNAAVRAMTLDHYPGMTERKLAEIEAEARRRWPLREALIIHRYGRLEAGDRIVLVVTASAHRAAAFDACRFLVDWLKTKAPFWKLEETPEGARWVAAQAEDAEAAAAWTGQGRSRRARIVLGRGRARGASPGNGRHRSGQGRSIQNPRRRQARAPSLEAGRRKRSRPVLFSNAAVSVHPLIG